MKNKKEKKPLLWKQIATQNEHSILTPGELWELVEGLAFLAALVVGVLLLIIGKAIAFFAIVLFALLAHY